MIKFGDIEPAHVINCTDFLDEVAREIGVESDVHKIGRSKLMFKKFKDSEETKR